MTKKVQMSSGQAADEITGAKKEGQAAPQQRKQEVKRKWWGRRRKADLVFWLKRQKRGVLHGLVLLEPEDMNSVITWLSGLGCLAAWHWNSKKITFSLCIYVIFLLTWRLEGVKLNLTNSGWNIWNHEQIKAHWNNSTFSSSDNNIQTQRSIYRVVLFSGGRGPDITFSRLNNWKHK